MWEGVAVVCRRVWCGVMYAGMCVCACTHVYPMSLHTTGMCMYYILQFVCVHTYVFCLSYFDCTVHVSFCPSSPVDSFEVLREKLGSACRDAEEKEAAWRIVAADNARQRLILEEQ